MSEDNEVKSEPVSQPPVLAEDAVYVSKCCRRGDNSISKGLLKFLITTVFSALVLLFAMYKLSTDTSSDEKALYYSLLASTCAHYMPSPTPNDSDSINKAR